MTPEERRRARLMAFPVNLAIVATVVFYVWMVVTR